MACISVSPFGKVDHYENNVTKHELPVLRMPTLQPSVSLPGRMTTILMIKVIGLLEFLNSTDVAQMMMMMMMMMMMVVGLLR